MLRPLLKEPLAHFLVLALMIFAVYAVSNPSDTRRPDQVVIKTQKIEQLASLFAATWQRPPTVTELKGLIDDYVKEEIYFREALALGLDKNDTLIRRRLRQKMEFLIDSEAEGSTPTDAELEAYLRANPGKFEIDPMMALRQVYLSPEQRGEKIDQDASAILKILISGDPTDPAALGDVTLLPSELSLMSKTAIGRMFGREFAEAVDKVAAGQWMGPIKSTFGLHIIRITERKSGRIPALDEVRSIVTRGWANEKRKSNAQVRFRKLQDRYQVIIESPAQAGVMR
jgi:hypothetical protein